MKSKGAAYLLWFFLGAFGVHRFYLGKIGTGILYLCTLGLCGIGWLVDLFTLSKQVDTYNSLHFEVGSFAVKATTLISNSDSKKEILSANYDPPKTKDGVLVYPCPNVVADIEYHDIEGIKTLRHITIRNLIVWRDRDCGLYAYCHLRHDFRTFSLYSIKKLIVAGEQKEPPAFFDELREPYKNMFPFVGKSFCFSGKLKSMTHETAEEFILAHGGVYKAQLSKNVMYLVTNDLDTDPCRIAQVYGTKIISENNFLKMADVK